MRGVVCLVCNYCVLKNNYNLNSKLWGVVVMDSECFTKVIYLASHKRGAVES